MDCPVIVDIPVEFIPAVEQLDYFVGIFVRVTDLIVNDASILQQNLIVEVTITQSHHGRIPLNVVELVHVN